MSKLVYGVNPDEFPGLALILPHFNPKADIRMTVAARGDQFEVGVEKVTICGFSHGLDLICSAIPTGKLDISAINKRNTDLYYSKGDLNGLAEDFCINAVREAWDVMVKAVMQENGKTLTNANEVTALFRRINTFANRFNDTLYSFFSEDPSDNTKTVRESMRRVFACAMVDHIKTGREFLSKSLIVSRIVLSEDDAIEVMPTVHPSVDTWKYDPNMDAVIIHDTTGVHVYGVESEEYDDYMSFWFHEKYDVYLDGSVYEGWTRHQNVNAGIDYVTTKDPEKKYFPGDKEFEDFIKYLCDNGPDRT